MKLFGHPVHIMLVHFPAALLPMDLVCSGLYFFTLNSSFGQAAFYALVGGVISGWIAIGFGLLDLLKIPSDKPKAQNTGWIHGSVNTLVIIGYSVLAYQQWKVFPEIISTTVFLLLLKGLLISLLMAGNYFGGNLLLKYHIGFQPESK